MGLELSTLATIASVGSTVVSGVGAIAQGNAQAAAYKAQAEEMERQRQAARTQALQEETQRRQQLLSDLSTIDAVRAGRGLAADSPSGATIRSGVREDALTDLANIQDSATLKDDALRRAALQARSDASSARLGGFLGAGTSLLTAGSRLAGISARGNKG